MGRSKKKRETTTMTTTTTTLTTKVTTTTTTISTSAPTTVAPSAPTTITTSAPSIPTSTNAQVPDDQQDDSINLNTSIEPEEDYNVHIANINSRIEKILGTTDYYIDSFKVTPYYEDYLMGLLGSHCTNKINVTMNETKKQTLHLFLKSLPKKDDFRKNYVKKQGYFDKEFSYYLYFEDQLLQQYSEERWSPIMYYEYKDTFVFEDLLHQGYNLHPNWFDCKIRMMSALNALARFHGSFILFETFHVLNKNQQSIREILPEALLKETAFNKSNELFDEWMDSSIRLACQIYEKYTGQSDSLDIKTIADRMYYEVNASSVHRNVLCHGDLWWNNMLFDSKAESPVDKNKELKCRFVDYQMIRYGPQVHDLLQLIYLHSTQKWRSNYEKEMLEYYLKQLNKVVQSSNLRNFAKVPNISELVYAYNDRRVYGLTCACLYLPFCLMKKDFLDQCINDREGLGRDFINNRLEFTNKHLMNENKEIERIIEVVIEMREYSELVLSFDVYHMINVMRSDDDD